MAEDLDWSGVRNPDLPDIDIEKSHDRFTDNWDNFGAQTVDVASPGNENLGPN